MLRQDQPKQITMIQSQKKHSLEVPGPCTLSSSLGPTSPTFFISIPFVFKFLSVPLLDYFKLVTILSVFFYFQIVIRTVVNEIKGTFEIIISILRLSLFKLGFPSLQSTARLGSVKDSGDINR